MRLLRLESVLHEADREFVHSLGIEGSFGHLAVLERDWAHLRVHHVREEA